MVNGNKTNGKAEKFTNECNPYSYGLKVERAIKTDKKKELSIIR